MATTTIPNTTTKTSAVIRQQLGRRRKALKTRLKEIKDDLPVIKELIEFDEEELVDCIADCHEFEEQISTELTKIEKLMEAWEKLCQDDPKEKIVKDKYFEKHGDIAQVVAEAEEGSKTIRRLFKEATEQMKRRFPTSQAEIPEWTFLRWASSTSRETDEQRSDKSTKPRVPEKTAHAVHERKMPVEIEPSLGSFAMGSLPPLPKAELPKFDGDILAFMEFKSRFESMIGRYPIDSTLKLDYLKHCITGDAERLIRSFPSTAVNYQLAWKALEDHFGGEDRVHHNLLCKLQDLPTIKHTTSGKDLFQFWTQASFLFGQLMQINQGADNATVALCLQRKMPNRVLEKLYDMDEKKIFTTTEFLDAISKIAKREMRIKDMQDELMTSQRVTTMSAVQQRGPEALPRRQDNVRPRFCAFCQSHSDHKNTNCPVYESTHKKKERAIILKLCFCCLKMNHRTAECRNSAHQCSVCNEHHKTHPALCFGRHRSPTRMTSPRQQRFENGRFQTQAPRVESSETPIRRQQYQSRNFGTGNRHYQSRHSNDQHRQGFQRQQNQLVPRNYRTEEGRTHAIIANEVQEEDGEYDNVMTMFLDNRKITDEPAMIEEGNDEGAEEDFMDAFQSIQREARPVTNNPLRQNPIIMMSKEVTVKDVKNKFVPAHMFIDHGSNRSYITSSLVEKLGLTAVATEEINVQTFGEEEGRRMTSNRYNITLEVAGRQFNLNLSTVNIITRSIVTTSVDDNDVAQMLNDQAIEVERKQVSPDLLIGLDHSNEILGDVQSRILPNGLCLFQTQIGAILCGTERQNREEPEEVIMERDPVDLAHRQPVGLIAIEPRNEHEQLMKTLENFWTIDSIGIREEELESDAERAMKMFNDSVFIEESGRYSVRLPFCDSTDDVPNNRSLAYYRLKSNLKKLESKPELLKKYDEVIRDQLKRGFIEEVKEEEIADGPLVHYIPHHSVIKESSTSTKLRIVYDAGAKANKTAPSLNDKLYVGMPLLPDLTGILLRSRMKPILISGDIEKAFLQMGLHVEDRDCCRFLWIESLERPRIVCYRFKRVPFGVRSSPFLLNAVINDICQRSDQPLAKEIPKSTYVDNFFHGVGSIEEGKLAFKDTKRIFEAACMKMCQFFCNSDVLNDYFAKMEGVQKPENKQKILGLQWNIASDHIGITKPKPPMGYLTKRAVLKTTASQYDPLGLLIPVMVRGKLFFQKLCCDKRSWDDRLNAECENEWFQILKGWSGADISIPRRYTTRDEVPVQTELHIFSDASQYAYGAAAYIRFMFKDECQTSLVFAKSRISPIKKKLSIPQLELLAIEIATTMMTFCIKELPYKFDNVILWSDSKCSIDLVKSGKGNTTFMRNRVKKIRQKIQEHQLRHVDGKENPADILSRGCSLDELRTNTLWWKGPGFLQDQRRQFNSPAMISKEDEATCLATIARKEVQKKQKDVIDIHRFSSYEKLHRILQIVAKFGNKGCRTDDAASQKATQYSIKLAQDEDPIADEKIAQMRLKKIDGIWTFTGRVSSSKPLYFLPQGQVADLIIKKVHEENRHASARHTLTEVRQFAWIPNGLQAAKKIVRRCLQCSREKSRSFKQPDFPDFPDARIQVTPPFQFSGMDFAGPLKVKTKNGIEKRWILLFSCLSTRYIHCELLEDTSAHSTILGIRRLCSIYGCPQWINCDNGTGFVTIDAIFQECRANREQLPTIHFNSPYSPWQGGHYERLIGLLKASLVKAGSTKTLMSPVELMTLMSECAAIVNRRPITAVAEDEDIRTIRPVDLVIPHFRSNLLLRVDEGLETQLPRNQAEVLEYWQGLTTLTEGFQQQWQREYPAILRQRMEFEHRQKNYAEKEAPAVGEIVLLESEEKSKLNWPLAKVIEVKERSAIVFRGDTRRTLERPFKKIYSLEHVSKLKDEQLPNKKTEQTSIRPGTHPMVRRSTRRSTGTTSLAIMFLLCLSTATMAHEEPIGNNTISESDKWKELITFENMMKMTTLLTLACCISILLNCCLWIKGICHGIYKVINIIYTLAMMPFTLSRRCLQRILPSRNRRARYRSVIAVLIFVWTFGRLVKEGNACSDTASFQTTDQVCRISKDGQRCSTNSVIQMTLQSGGPSGCIRISDDKTNHTVEVRIHEMRWKCTKRTMYFTRDYSLQYEYTHRCYKAGSCQEDKCRDTKADEDLPELSTYAKQAPGFTRCVSGCGCVSCSGCFFCQPSCIFYRTYAKPISYHVAEVFRCQQWTPLVDVLITTDSNVELKQLIPGRKTIFTNGITITTSSFSTPHINTLSYTFLKYAGAVLYTADPVAAPGAPQENILGDLQCSTKKDAEQFNCRYNEHSCKCHTQGMSVKCDCSKFEVRRLVKQNQLPLETEVIIIRHENHQVEAISKQSTVLQIQVEFKNTTFHRTVQEDQCFAEPSHITLTGCFNCIRGIPVKFTCSSSSKQPRIASLVCSHSTFSVHCDQRLNQLVLQANSKKLNETCALSCGSKSSSVTFSGELFMLESFDQDKKQYTAFHERIFSAAGWNPIDSVRRFVTTTVDGFRNILICLFVLLVISIIIRLVCTFYPPLRLATSIRRYRTYRRRF